jgi:uncharacterized protein (DUF736 family)
LQLREGRQSSPPLPSPTDIFTCRSHIIEGEADIYDLPPPPPLHNYYPSDVIPAINLQSVDGSTIDIFQVQDKAEQDAQAMLRGFQVGDDVDLFRSDHDGGNVVADYDVGAGYIGASYVGASDVGAGYIGTSDVGADYVGDYVGGGDVGAGYIGTSDVGADYVGDYVGGGDVGAGDNEASYGLHPFITDYDDAHMHMYY